MGREARRNRQRRDTERLAVVLSGQDASLADEFERMVEQISNWTPPVIEPLDATEAEDEQATADAEAGRWPVG